MSNIINKIGVAIVVIAFILFMNVTWNSIKNSNVIQDLNTSNSNLHQTLEFWDLVLPSDGDIIQIIVDLLFLIAGGVAIWKT